MVDSPSLSISRRGGIRKSEKVKICRGKSKLIISSRLDNGLKRLEFISSSV